MDDVEDRGRYQPRIRIVNHQPGYGLQKLPIRIASYSKPSSTQYIKDDYGNDNGDDDDDEEEEEEEEEEEIGDYKKQINGVNHVTKNLDNGDDAEGFDDDDDDDHDEEEDDDELDQRKNQGGRLDGVERRAKKRKMKSLVSSYEFAPRVPSQADVAPPIPKSSFGGRNNTMDWTEHETFVLLDAWGDLFLKHGRKSLRSEDWHKVAEKVSEVSKIDRTDSQCRNRLDTLKKKYKKEKARLAETGGNSSKWLYFKRMDTLMWSPPQQTGLSCGLDSGEYSFMNAKVYLNRANGMDEMRDSPGNSEPGNGAGDDSDGLPPKKRKTRRKSMKGPSMRLLADSIQKFSDIYEKIENSRRQQIVELEKMRMDFHRDLDIQRRQIMERAQAEIMKITEGRDEDNDPSTENASG